MKALLARLAQGDGVLDIGANVGTMAQEFAAKVGPLGHVLAVEPNPDVAALCRRNTAVFGCVSVRAVAVDWADGQAELYVGTNHTHSSLAAANVHSQSGTVTVDTTTLDALAAGVPKLAAIKIDAQGAEARILQGGAACLARPGLIWMVELWPDGVRACGSTVEALLGAFATTGHRVLAMGKMLTEPARTWEGLAAPVASWHGHTHTNLLIGRSA